MAIFASVVFATLLPIVCKVTVFFSHNQISTYFLQKKIVFAPSLLPSFGFGYSCSVLAATVPRALGHLEYLERLLFISCRGSVLIAAKRCHCSLSPEGIPNPYRSPPLPITHAACAAIANRI